MAKIGRNDPCPCGSGKKYKKCCLKKDQASAPAGLPTVMTASGEEFSFRQARYDVIDQDEIIARLNQDPDFEADEPEDKRSGEISYTWLEAGDSAKLMKTIKGMKPPTNPILGNLGEGGSWRILGDLKIKGGKLLFNATGERRFELGKKRLESLSGSSIRHRIDTVQSMESALANRGQGKDMGSSSPGPAIKIDPADPKFAPLKPGETIQDALKNRAFNSLDEANAFLQQAMGDYNSQPQEEMGGLSPVQVRDLMACDWEDPEGPIRLNKTLSLAELAHTPLLHNARLLLQLAQQRGGIKATGAGYLDTAVVREVIHQGVWPERWSEEYQRKAEGRLREMDIRYVYALRLICSFAGLLKEARGSFQLTHHGNQMLTDEYAGRLYKRLFFVLFQHLDLDLFDRHGLFYPDIQKGIPFSIYQLSHLKVGEWYVLAEVAPKLLLPAVKWACARNENPSQWNEHQIQGVVKNFGYRLIEPLEMCGLVETRDFHRPLLDLSPTMEFKVSALYSRFISFSL